VDDCGKDLSNEKHYLQVRYAKKRNAMIYGRLRTARGWRVADGGWR
jgi:hypothetical protein